MLLLSESKASLHRWRSVASIRPAWGLMRHADGGPEGPTSFLPSNRLYCLMRRLCPRRSDASVLIDGMLLAWAPSQSFRGGFFGFLYFVYSVFESLNVLIRVFMIALIGFFVGFFVYSNSTEAAARWVRKSDIHLAPL